MWLPWHERFPDIDVALADLLKAIRCQAYLDAPATRRARHPEHTAPGCTPRGYHHVRRAHRHEWHADAKIRYAKLERYRSGIAGIEVDYLGAKLCGMPGDRRLRVHADLALGIPGRVLRGKRHGHRLPKEPIAYRRDGDLRRDRKHHGAVDTCGLGHSRRRNNTQQNQASTHSNDRHHHCQQNSFRIHGSTLSSTEPQRRATSPSAVDEMSAGSPDRQGFLRDIERTTPLKKVRNEFNCAHGSVDSGSGGSKAPKRGGSGRTGRVPPCLHHITH